MNPSAPRPEAPAGSSAPARRLPPGQQLVAGDRWPLVGERSCLPVNGPWRVRVDGLVHRPLEFTLDELNRLPQSRLVMDIHCVTRWTRPDTVFEGVLLAHLLQHCEALPAARFVSFVARTERRHSSSLPLAEAIDPGAMLALRGDGQALPAEHGGPVRGVVPGKYFYKSVKWVEQLELLAEDRPGYWESEAGYHNGADPWKQQRYIAASIDRREAARLMESRNFEGKDLLSLDAADRDLSGLRARRSRMRNASFARSALAGADFREANLSNADFRGADLRGAVLAGADLEGADFAGADLRDADLRGCSLFGTTFCEIRDGQADAATLATIDATTLVDREAIAQLAGGQPAIVARALGW